MKKTDLRIIIAGLCFCVFFTSCVSTYNTTNINVVSESEADSSIHLVKESEIIKAKNTLDMKLIGFYTFGYPLVITGCTLRETVRILGYSALNLLSGEFAYERLKRNESASGLFLPDVKKALKEYNEFEKAYRESDLYKYRKYRKALSKAVISKSNLVEEIDWNDVSKVVSSTTETIRLETKVRDSAERISKKASLTGSKIGTVTSVVFAIPSFILGFIIGVGLDAS